MINKVAIIRKGDVEISKLLEAMKRDPNIRECGAIVSFIGIVRGIGYDGSRVKYLHYETEEEVAIKELEEVRNEVLRKYDVKEVLIYHYIGTLEPGSDTIYIMVAAKHREPAFEAARYALELVKKRVHIWKKEVTEEGEYWIMGEEIVKV